MRRELAREPSIDCGSEDTVPILRTRQVMGKPIFHPLPHFTRCALHETIGLSQPRAAGGLTQLTVVKYLKLVLLSLPVAILASCDVLIGTGRDGGWDEGIDIWIIAGIFVLIWVGLVLWTSIAPTTAKSRTRLYGVLAAIGFLTPVPGAVHWAAAGDVADPIFPVCTMFILGLLVGVPAGLFGIWRFRRWSDETI